MRYLIILLGILIGIASAAGQQSDARARAAAEKLLILFNVDQNYEKSMEQLIMMVENTIDAQQMSKEGKQKAKEIVTASMWSTMREMQWEKMKGVFIDIYAETFTSEELEEIVALYETPIGKKFIAKQPQLTTVTLQKMQGLIQSIMPEVQRKVQEAIEKNR